MHRLKCTKHKHFQFIHIWLVLSRRLGNNRVRNNRVNIWITICIPKSSKTIVLVCFVCYVNENVIANTRQKIHIVHRNYPKVFFCSFSLSFVRAWKQFAVNIYDIVFLYIFLVFYLIFYSKCGTKAFFWRSQSDHRPFLQMCVFNLPRSTRWLLCRIKIHNLLKKNSFICIFFVLRTSHIDFECEIIIFFRFPLPILFSWRWVKYFL